METDPTRQYRYTVLSSKNKTNPSDSLEVKMIALNKFVTHIVNLNNTSDIKCSLVGGITFGDEGNGIHVYQAILISFPKEDHGMLRRKRTRKSKRE